jgi:hypothetical protein
MPHANAAAPWLRVCKTALTLRMPGQLCSRLQSSGFFLPSLRRAHTFSSLADVQLHFNTFTTTTNTITIVMEKQTINASSDGDYETAAFLNPSHLKDSSTTRRLNYVYLTLFNLFIFTLSMLSLICAVMSQKDNSSHSAAKLMDQFDIFSPAMHEVEYSHVKYSLPKPLNTSKYVGTTEEVEMAWMDIAYRKLQWLRCI